MKTVMSLCLQRRIRKDYSFYHYYYYYLLLLTTTIIIIYIVISTFFVLYLVVLLFLRRGCEACLSSRQFSFLKGLVFVVFVIFLCVRYMFPLFLTRSKNPPTNLQKTGKSLARATEILSIISWFFRKKPLLFLLSNSPSL
jgi:hypothetical protein